MAIRTDASNEWLVKTGETLTDNNMTFCWWVEMVTDRNDWQCVGLCVDDNDTSSGSFVYVEPTSAASNNFVLYWQASGQYGNTSNGPTITTASGWHFLAIVVNTDDYTLYWGTPGSTLSSSTDNGSEFFSGDRYRVSESPYGGEWANCRYANVLMWVGSTFTQAQLETQMRSFTPITWQNLHAWYPLLGTGSSAHLRDWGPDGRHLSQGAAGTPTTEDGPPIALSPVRQWTGISFVAAPPVGGLSIPVAMHHYRRRRAGS